MNEAKFKIKKLGNITLVIIILLIFISFTSNLTPWKGSSWVASQIQKPLYLIESIWHKSIFSIQKTWSHYVNLTQVANENTELKNKLLQLESENFILKNKEKELTRLKETLGFLKKYDHQVKLVEITSKRLYPPFQSFRINHGLDSKIKVGMPVVGTKGVVGRIIRTASNFSDIQLLIDNSFNLDVMLERTRVQMTLQGTGEQLCQIRLNHRSDIKLDDRIISSGISSSFPEGLPIGKVIQIQYESDLIEQIITVKPWVNFSTLKEAVIINQRDLNFEMISKLAPSGWFKKVIQELKPNNKFN